jgi:hypothetical protein
MLQFESGNHPNYTLSTDHDVHHWVVITGFSEAWDRGSGWEWVRIFNPFINGSEYYTSDEIHKSHQAWKHYNQVGVVWSESGDDSILWVSK